MHVLVVANTIALNVIGAGRWFDMHHLLEVTIVLHTEETNVVDDLHGTAPDDLAGVGDMRV